MSFLKNKINIVLIFAFFIFWLLGYITELNFKTPVNQVIDTTYVKNVIIQKENLSKQLFKKIAAVLPVRSFREFNEYCLINIKKSLNDEGIAFLLYENDTLKYWTDNSFNTENIYSGKFFDSKIIRTKNNWLLNFEKDTSNYRIIFLATLKHEYSYENNFLKNEFQKDFKLSDNINISITPDNAGTVITDSNGNYFFTLIPQYYIRSDSLLWVSAVFYSLAIVLFFVFVALCFGASLFSNGYKFWGVLLFAVVIRWLMMHYHFPSILYKLPIYDPKLFASSDYFPNLGDVIINLLLIFGFSYVFYRSGTLKLKLKNSRWALIYSFVFALISSGILLFLRWFAINLVFDSSINLELNNILKIDFYSIISYLLLASIFVAYILITSQLVLLIKDYVRITVFLIMPFVLAVLFSSIILIYSDFYDAISFAFISVTSVLLISLAIYGNRKALNTSLTIALLLFFSIYIVVSVNNFSFEKETEIREILITKLANERDPVAEIQIPALEQKIRNDRQIKDLMGDYLNKIDELYNYITNYYFHGYWNKYDIQITVCKETDTLNFEEINLQQNCFKYFNNILTRQGIPVGTSSFVFLDNMNGRISYLGVIDFKQQKDSSVVNLFIEADSKLISEELGYPELLLGNKASKPELLKEYSYAKYRKKELVYQSGSFVYNLKLDYYGEFNHEFVWVNKDKFRHLVYKINEDNYIILSKPSSNYYDLLIMFSYIFVLLVITYLLYIILKKVIYWPKKSDVELKFKIQATIISVLILSLFFIGGGTIFYNINQFKKKQFETIGEKAQSILIELQNKLGKENQLNPAIYDYLDYLLINFSNVFYSDINLYSPDGSLIASSRQEIFDNGLIGPKMNPEAFYELYYLDKAEFVHDEKIGALSYISLYVPFYNNNHKLLAYLNLPYFSKENVLRNDISTLVITIVNIYVLLILITIIITVFVSNSITKPLRLLQSKMAEIKLQGKNEPINYTANDEVGKLVNEYNILLKELEINVDKLARSERESAWREMARQIAHEIKNPLTPMKLNIQHLQRAWADNAPDLKEKMDKVTKSLIEQIDALSAIASEFSSFSQLSHKKLEKVSIKEKIESVVNTFCDIDNVEISIHFPKKTDLYIWADREQILRVFNNIIKNAIQAIPEDRKGIIRIVAEVKNKNIEISVSDNGIGIPEEMKDKLFVPNFTTKTSGMGLGLAIVKNIIETSGGDIRFESEAGRGTTFYVEFPLV